MKRWIIYSSHLDKISWWCESVDRILNESIQAPPHIVICLVSRSCQMIDRHEKDRTERKIFSISLLSPLIWILQKKLNSPVGRLKHFWPMWKLCVTRTTRVIAQAHAHQSNLVVIACVWREQNEIFLYHFDVSSERFVVRLHIRCVNSLGMCFMCVYAVRVCAWEIEIFFRFPIWTSEEIEDHRRHRWKKIWYFSNSPKRYTLVHCTVVCMRSKYLLVTCVTSSSSAPHTNINNRNTNENEGCTESSLSVCAVHECRTLYFSRNASCECDLR